MYQKGIAVVLVVVAMISVLRVFAPISINYHPWPIPRMIVK